MIRAGVFPQNHSREFVRVLAELERREGRADRAYDGHKHPMPLDAADNADQSAPCILDRADMRIEKFLDVCVVQHFQSSHDVAPAFVGAKHARGKCGTAAANYKLNFVAPCKPTDFHASVEQESNQFVVVPCVGTSLCSRHRSQELTP